jgi:succinyl-diaminopimelate desuccinylase
VTTVDPVLLDALIHAPVDDLLALGAALVAVPSVSHAEGPITGAIEQRLRTRAPNLELTRIGDNIVARTSLGRDRRVLVGGHVDTVPVNDNAIAVVEGDVLRGLGSADMKGSLAALLALAERASAREPRVDVTFCWYAGEEVVDEFNGLRHLFEVAPELLACDLAILAEPTDGWVEAGCQGTIHLRAGFSGARAHTARPWMGENAIHKATRVLERIAAHESDTVSVDGLDFRESVQVVSIEGGVANNVVPDHCTLVVNRRFAPKYSIDEARAQVEALLDGADSIELVSAAPAAAPGLTNALVAEFVGTLDLSVRPKLGWTDVARFTSHGIPALNFGAGDPTIAHTQGELVTRDSVEGCFNVLAEFLGLR